MAVCSIAVDVDAGDTKTPLLPEDTVEDTVDYRGFPAVRSRSGRWRSASFIIGVEVAERIAYYGIASNLISYLTGPLGQSTAAAAANVNAWSGVASLLPVLGAVVADSFLGRYRTIIISSLIYILGLGLLTLSATLSSISPSNCHKNPAKVQCDPPRFQVIMIYLALYIVAIGQGGHKPCVQAFGADQFDGKDPVESKSKSSFFNWWYFSLCMGPLLALLVLNYIQDYVDWSLGFGIPCIIMGIALVVFLLGTMTYRHVIKGEERSPFLRIGQVFVAAARNWRATQTEVSVREEARGMLPSHGSQQFKFLNKALLSMDASKESGTPCTINDVAETKALLRLFPIWATSLIYAIIFSQSSTFFTKQGVTLDRSITSTISIPAASLQSFISLSVVLFVPIYDRVFVPLARTLTQKPSGLTMLQRIGTGMFISAVSMVVAAVVEGRRLKIALEHGLIDSPDVTVPMKVWWLIPQYALFGIADVFTMVGLQEFFYDQVPTELRSVGLSLYLSIFGVGSLLSSLVVSGIDRATGGSGGASWFSDNLNRAHLDYFYWLLASVSAVGLALFLYFARSYVYKNRNI